MHAPKIIKDFFRDENFYGRLTFFRQVSLFRGLSGRQIGRLMRAMQQRNYRSGEILFSEGQVGKAVFIIESGRVELTRQMPNGEIRSLGILGNGLIFGEMALLEHLERTATARVIEDGLIHLLYTADLESLIRQNPSIGVKIMRNIAMMLSALLRRTNQEFDRRVSPRESSEE